MRRESADGGGSPYAGQTVAVGTMHGKAEQFAAPLRRWHQASVRGTTVLDTDALGTFTGERARTLLPVDAAAAKARGAIEETGFDLGLATEASYVTSAGGFGPVIHEEIAVFLDRRRGVRVVESVRSFAAVAPPAIVSTLAEAEALLARIGFPAQGVVLRAADGSVTKGVTDAAEVRRALAKGVTTVEPDLRAHVNPARRRTLRRLGWLLAARLRRHCPACSAPGFGRTGVVTGVACGWCGAPTRAIRADVHGCGRCEFREEVDRGVSAADPANCDRCNP